MNNQDRYKQQQRQIELQWYNPVGILTKVIDELLLNSVALITYDLKQLLNFFHRTIDFETTGEKNKLYLKPFKNQITQ